MASITDLGTQHVSIYPYQNLDSVLGNQLLLNVIQPGVSNAKVTIAKVATNLQFTISAGSTFVFHRRAVADGTTTTYNIIGKIVLGDSASFTVSNEAVAALPNKFYIVADWVYNKNAANARFVEFSVEATAPVLDTSNDAHKLCIAVVLNNDAFVGPAYAESSLRISYQEQTGRSYLQPLYNRSNTFPISFQPDGNGIIVGTGEVFVGGKLFVLTSPASLAVPSAKLEVVDPLTGAVTDISASTSNYFQVNFLRIKRNEATQTVEAGWDSFARPRAGFESLDFSTYTLTQDELKSYIAAQDFTLKDEGLILAINVTNYSGNRPIWSQNTVVLYTDSEILSTMSTPYSDRSAISVYTSSDIVGLGA